jgi:hypothetical protein
MVQPIDYSINVQNPFQAGLTGFQQGMQIQNLRAQQNEQQRARQRAQQMQNDLAEFSMQENKTGEDYANMIARYPDLGDSFKQQFSMMSESQQQARIKQAQQLYQAMELGDDDLVMKTIDRQATAFENSGDQQSADMLRAMGMQYDINPNVVKTNTALMLQFADPGFLDRGKVKRTARQSEWLQYATMPANTPEERQRKHEFGRMIGAVPPEMKYKELSARENVIKDLSSKSDSITDVLGTIELFNDNPDYIDAISGYRGRVPITVSPAATEAEAYLNNIASSLTMENMSKMKGVLSDSDIKMLKAASLRIKPGMRKETIKRELKLIQSKLRKAQARYNRQINSKVSELKEKNQQINQENQTGSFETLSDEELLRIGGGQ